MSISKIVYNLEITPKEKANIMQTENIQNEQKGNDAKKSVVMYFVM